MSNQVKEIQAMYSFEEHELICDLIFNHVPLQVQNDKVIRDLLYKLCLNREKLKKGNKKKEYVPFSGNDGWIDTNV